MAKKKKATPKHKSVGKYRIIRKIGMGGMSTVYQAYDPFMERSVALKLPSPNSSMSHWDAEMYQRMFFNETHVASRLHHPNIVELYDAGIDGKKHYIAMEYVPGGITLEKYCRPENLLPIEIMADMILKCAEALDYAHRQGVIHRDIKPRNILLRGDRDIKISDFSIAILTSPDLADTQVVAPMGTPKYMAPERLLDDAATNQSDLFSLGIVMYELLTGHHPFEAESIASLTHKIINDEPEPPGKFRPGIPESFEEITLHLLMKNPHDRYSSAYKFARDVSLCFHDFREAQDGQETMTRADMLKKLGFFSSFGDAEIWELLRWAEWQNYQESDYIIVEGETGDAVYILVDGEVGVFKHKHHVANLSSGELFGEIAYLSEGHRTASIRALSNVSVLCINADILQRASTSCQLQFQKVFISTLIERLNATTERLSSQAGK